MYAYLLLNMVTAYNNTCKDEKQHLYILQTWLVNVPYSHKLLGDINFAIFADNMHAMKI